MSTPASGSRIPVRLGLGTSGMGEVAEHQDQETAAVKFALDLGYRLIDTAEDYGKGQAERLVGDALRAFGPQRRAEIFIMSKVYPENASRAGTVKACEASIERLGCEYIDLYLLHWRGPHPFTETLQAFDELSKRKLVRGFGVSNFDVDDLVEWRQAEKRLGIFPGASANEISYRLNRRGIEYGQLDWHRSHGLQTIGYGPLGQGDLPQHPAVRQVAVKRGITPGQVALAWCLRIPDIITIPKSVKTDRIRENFEALKVTLTPDDLQQLHQAFPLKHRWLKANPLLRLARSTARKIVRRMKPPASRTAKPGAPSDHG
ncbi:MAG: aldo/keto reductase [Steroidobacteraceae bacterium]